MLVKALANVEGLSREGVSELKALASFLGGVPVIVSERMKTSELADGTVHDRYGVYASNLKTFSHLINGDAPRVYSTRGNYCVHVNSKLLSDARHRQGLTQEMLADRLGVSKQSVYRYEAYGRVSLDVFQRFAELFKDELVEDEFRLRFKNMSEGDFQRHPQTKFKRMVCRELEEMGFNTTLTNAPFDLIASQEERVFSVVSNDWRRLHYKLSVLEELTDLLGGYRLCVSERKVKGKISVLSPEELAQIRSPRELFKLLSD